jgi:hypothetical protein
LKLFYQDVDAAAPLSPTSTIDRPGSAFSELLNTGDALDKYQQVSDKVTPSFKLKVNPFDFYFIIERDVTLYQGSTKMNLEMKFYNF